ncbi:hypothetical protein LXL04_009054 [Taraxacum kok-saghyz]
MQAKRHFTEALVDGNVLFKLGDDGYVQLFKYTYLVSKCRLKRARTATYLVPYSTYQNFPREVEGDGNESDFTISSEFDVNATVNEDSTIQNNKISEMRMLDLYSGCGAMSTGLCLGANMANLNLVTVRNESAEDFLQLLKEWEKLCQSYSLIGGGDSQPKEPATIEEDEEVEEEDDNDVDNVEIFEVDQILSICYGDPKEIKKRDLYLKVRWKGYGPEEDTWEPLEGLNDCHDKIKEFVIRLCFAMTINKAQGQTIQNVGIYLPEPVFPHGQLYIALSRGISRGNTKVLVKPNDRSNGDDVYTSNVIYKEVLFD